MKAIGRYGELRVVSRLLSENVEAYLANDVNEPDFDITVGLSKKKVKRVQVKSTELHNKGTNNAISRIDKKYDFLIVVIVEEKDSPRFFVLTKAEALKLKGKNKQLGVTQQRNKRAQVKDSLIPFEDEWAKIKNA